MRRRRRQPTQILRKKANPPVSGTPYYVSPGSSAKNRRFIYAFLAFIILAFISYYVYNLAGPADEIEAVQPDSKTTTDIETESLQNEQVKAPFEHKIQIEILNGCGVNGVARVFQSYLREQGYDVVNTENYSVNGKLNWDVKKTFIIDHIGVLEQSKDVARSLGISSDHIESRQSQQPLYDVSVVIGKDYKSLLPQ